ncbi:hypothetical protein SODALDRAFT_351158 [Sodiomyces alkalinus F11]|uniref:Copper transport protein n=1 Tax=Sodiomyces alkalinus (strain CBS 110278 / VKM F-3762 / F11) TaxID=1314773 RepID=A0A3N2PTZ9_SODAK|nr:hypothetical protein SODALDRAFT_351158 [Sodiomyces alkalinus F11]ROT37983.1 hypothetical protein SODALDRAFT_351158 [Sodiomyces alkalinus F11]
MAYHHLITRNLKPITLAAMFHSTPIALFFPHDPEYAFWVNCVSVALLALFLRLLLAFRPALERTVWSVAALRATLRVGPVPREGDDGGDDDGGGGGGGESGRDEDDDDDDDVEFRGTDDPTAKQRHSVRTLPWALKPFGTAPLSHVDEAARISILRARRAMYEVLIAFVGYLVFISILSLNIAYFVSALVGLFFGNLMIGRDDIDESNPPPAHFQSYSRRR